MNEERGGHVKIWENPTNTHKIAAADDIIREREREEGGGGTRAFCVLVNTKSVQTGWPGI